MDATFRLDPPAAGLIVIGHQMWGPYLGWSVSAVWLLIDLIRSVPVDKFQLEPKVAPRRLSAQNTPPRARSAAKI